MTRNLFIFGPGCPLTIPAGLPLSGAVTALNGEDLAPVWARQNGAWIMPDSAIGACIRFVLDQPFKNCSPGSTGSAYIDLEPWLNVDAAPANRVRRGLLILQAALAARPLWRWFVYPCPHVGGYFVSVDPANAAGRYEYRQFNSECRPIIEAANWGVAQVYPYDDSIANALAMIDRAAGMLAYLCPDKPRGLLIDAHGWGPSAHPAWQGKFWPDAMLMAMGKRTESLGLEVNWIGTTADGGQPAGEWTAKMPVLAGVGVEAA